MSMSEIVRHLARFGLASFMLVAGFGHFNNTHSFRAQVPPFLPNPDLVIYISGVIEIAFGLSLVFSRKYRTQIGWLLAAFFVVIFPGNIAQFVTQTSAFGLETDQARAVRLLFQPVLVAWALWCTGAYQKWRTSRLQGAE